MAVNSALRVRAGFLIPFRLTLAAAGKPGIVRALPLLKIKPLHDMRLMGVRLLANLSRKNLVFARVIP